MPDIAFWHQCNNNCVMCTNPTEFFLSRPRRYSFGGQKKKLDDYLSGRTDAYVKNPSKGDYFLFTGGEPTLHPRFLELIRHFRGRLPGADLRLLTNGRRFQYGDFTARFLDCAGEPFMTAVSLHGCGPKGHDSITRTPGSFLQTVAGLHNLLALKPAGHLLEVRLVLHKMSIRGLAGILTFLLKEFPETGGYRLALIFFESEGQAEAAMDSLWLTLTEAASAILKNRKLLARFAAPRLYHFPLCVLGKPLRRLAEVTLPEDERVYGGKCAVCAQRRSCVGLMRWYYSMYGDSELASIK